MILKDSPRAVGGRMGTVGKKSGRLVSLDLLRGLTVIGMIVVNSVAGAEQTYPLLLHSV